MFNPFDGAYLITGTFLSVTVGIIAGNSPVVVTAVGAIITGLFVLMAKGIELYVRSRTDKRIARLLERAERAERALAFPFDGD